MFVPGSLVLHSLQLLHPVSIFTVLFPLVTGGIISRAGPIHATSYCGGGCVNAVRSAHHGLSQMRYGGYPATRKPGSLVAGGPHKAALQRENRPGVELTTPAGSPG